MNLSLRRTISRELTLLLSLITTAIAVIIGLGYFYYASHSVTKKLLSEAEQTTVELSQVLKRPLYNFDHSAVGNIAEVYLTSGRICGIRVEAAEIGIIFDNMEETSSSLPRIQKNILKDNLELGSITLVFDDGPIVIAKKRAVIITVFSIITIILIYIISLRFILRRILITPLTNLGRHLKEIADGTYEGRLAPVPQEDLNSIINAANKMSDEITLRTKNLMENEKNYRTVYNSTSDAFVIHDAEDGAIVDVNQAMLDMYGYTREEVIMLRVDDLSQGDSPFSQKEAEALVKAAIDTGPQLFQWLARRKDGTLFWVEVALKKTYISDFEVVLAAVRDISERIELEDQLRQAQKLEAIGTLAGGIAHDFNNILASILGFTELSLLKADKQSDIYRNLRQVEKASGRARDLVQQILAFSRKQTPEKSVVQLAPLIREAMNLMRSTIPTTVEIKLDLSSQAKIIADQGQIHQLIMNLCTNGYQAMQDSTGTLAISLTDLIIDQLDPLGALDLVPGRYVVIEVSDNGSGMDIETKNKIFEPYFTTKKTGKGTGLGLATVYGIVKSHHGRISVYSEVGIGTTFRIYLPVTEKKIDNPPTPYSSEVTSQQNKRVMVVDDEESLCQLMTEILTHGGYVTDSFNNASEAWDALAANPLRWDLLVTDQTMPHMTGIELVRKVFEIRPDMPVILCTGHSEMITSENAREIGIRAYLQKPVTVGEMLQAAHQALACDKEDHNE